MINVEKQVKVTRVANSAVAATTAITTSIIDMSGFDNCEFIGLLGDVLTTSVLSLKIQQGSLSDGSDMTDAVGAATTAHTATASDSDNKTLVVEIAKPREKYLRAVLSRSTASAVVDGVLALQSGPHDMPVTHDSTTTLATAFAASPA